MAGSKIDKLSRMANQIGEFYSVMPLDEGAAGVASHIVKFWTPKMIAELTAAIDEGAVTLNNTARAGLTALNKTAV